METTKQGRKPFLFFILTFAFSWILWLPSILAGLGVDLSIDATAYTSITVPIGAFAPLLAALFLIIKQNGWKGGWKFFKQAFDLKVKPLYLLAAGLIPIIIHLISHFLAPLLGFPVANTLFPAELNVPSILIAIPYFLLMLVIGGGQEEFGWRGYAQEPLQKRMGVIPASLLIGFVWGLWHLPLWVMPGDGHSTYPYIAFLIMTTSISVIYAWLFNASNQKLSTVIIFHAMSNTAAPLLPFLHAKAGIPETGYWVYAMINLLSALVVGYFILRSERKIKTQTRSV
ncbi:CPBP family intramembrane metalloprotease (plasmid) [Chloroflexota bacterium]|nr:CPBP family intramembrane metalloprotease [Chloroflexota bacterium]